MTNKTQPPDDTFHLYNGKSLPGIPQKLKHNDAEPKKNAVNLFINNEEDVKDIPQEIKDAFSIENSSRKNSRFTQQQPEVIEEQDSSSQGDDNEFQLNFEFTDIRQKNNSMQFMMITDDYEITTSGSYKLENFQQHKCPICFEMITTSNCCQIYSRKYEKNYYGHLECYKMKNSSQKQYELKSLKNVIVAEQRKEEVKLEPNLVKKELQFLIEFNLYHPISNYLIHQFFKKIDVYEKKNSGQAIININFSNNQATPIFEPQQLIIPIPEFRLNITIYNIDGEQSDEKKKLIIETFIDASNIYQPKEQHQLCFYADSNKFSFKLDGVLEKKTKEQFIQRTSYIPSDKIFTQKIQCFTFNTIQIQIPNYFTVEKQTPKLCSQIDNQTNNFIQGSLLSPSTQSHTFPLGQDDHNSNKFNVFSTSNSFSTSQDISFFNSKQFSPTPHTQQPIKNYKSSPNTESNFLSNLCDESNVNHQSPVFFFSDKIQNQGISQIQIQDLKISNTEIKQSGFSSSSLSKDDDTSSCISELQNLSEIKGKIVNYVKTQHGSRQIQKLFSKCSNQEIDQLISEIENYIAELMIDNYANYMFSFLSQSCTTQQRYKILQKISHKIKDIACDKKGTHALQSLVSLINSREEEELIEKSIKNDVSYLALDTQGTHLIKKIILRFSENNLNFVFDSLIPNFVEVVNHQYGLCVIKELMSKLKDNSDKKLIFIQLIEKNIDQIVQAPFGNYAIQHAIDTYQLQDYYQIAEKVISKILQLSNQKYSSPVVEKIMLNTSLELKAKVISQLCKDEITIELMKNKFGNYVLKNALKSCDNQEKKCLIDSIYRNLSRVTPQYFNSWQDYFQKQNICN